MDEFSDKNIKQVIIPTDDFAASTLDEFAPELLPYYYIPIVKDTPGELTKCMDKGLQKSIAERCGLNVAKARTIIVSENEYDIPEDIEYPCFTKPQMTKGSPKTFIRKCDSEDELRNLLTEVSKRGKCKILIEQYLPIDKEYVVPGCCLGDNVYIPAFIEKKRIGCGKHKGVTASGKVIDAKSMEAILEKFKNFVAEFKLFGLFDLELIESNGIIYFSELNLRNGAAGFGVTSAGVNLPGIYIEYCLNGKIPSKINSVKDGLTFVNEKVELDDYYAGYISWMQYKSNVNKEEVRFIVNNDDPVSGKVFNAFVRKQRIKRIIKNILRRR